MFVRKTSREFRKRILLSLLAGVFFLSSCSAFELREADGSTPVYTEAEPEPEEVPEIPKIAETAPPVPEPVETEPETEEIVETEPFRPAIPEGEREISGEAADWIAQFDFRFGEGASDTVILDPEEIEAYNRRMTENCPTLVNIEEIPETADGTALIGRISSYSFPQGDKFDRGGKPIDAEAREAILSNRALETIGAEVEVQPAIVTARCDLKTFPTSLGFYDSGDTFYSLIQQTELIVGMPVWVLHRSADGGYLYVQSYYYEGWISASAAAFCDRETFLSFCRPDTYVTVTAVKVDAGHTELDMGVVLPCVGETEENYIAVLPMREAGGSCSERETNIPKSDAWPGHLPYTMKNYYAQAFAYLGTQYGWGGADGGIDCSGFVCAVFRTFGIMLPRDTREQKDYAGEVVYTENYDAEATDGLLSSLRAPAALYRPKHVMLYLGKSADGMHRVIHAPKGGDFVKVAILDTTRPLSSVVEFR